MMKNIKVLFTGLILLCCVSLGYAQLTFTPNAVNACPTSGSISPVLGNGLSNVRYIKLTQKYAAEQQVAEIEAFEIFTGTNVARSTTGAVASASSTLGGYPASNVNDGNLSNFWHTNNANINEWVIIDLLAAKNIDYIKIYNRTDCCQDRGRNMLLELFNASNILVYSRTIDLWQSGANVPVNANVLDASWADGATTLNRTGLVAGTYTFNTADANGNVLNFPVTISAGSTNIAGLPSSTPTLCVNTALTNITRTTTGATGIGTATGLPAGVAVAWASNTITISGTPTASGTFNYTIPLTGGCGTVNATGTITVTAANTAGTASSTPTLKISTALTNITHTTTGATGIGTAIGLPSGVTAAWASNTITISGTPTVAGTFTYNIPLTGGSCSVNATGTITVFSAGPGGVTSGLNVWLRADAGVSAIGTSWQDQSGNGLHYTTVAGPTVIASDAGGNNIPAVEILSGGFNGPAGAAIGTSWTLFSMHRLLASDASGRLIDGATGNNLLGNQGVYSNGIYLEGNPGEYDAGIATTTNTQTKTLYCYSRDNATGSIIVRVNGTLLKTFTGTNSGSGLVWDLNQGVQSGERSHSRIGEFMIYNRALSGAEITNVESYLINKFCLTGGATMTAAAASSTPTVSINTALTNITHTTTIATGIGTATGLPAGVSVAWAANTITISGSPTASGTFNYSIPLKGGCGSVNATGTITVVTSNTAAAASSTPTLCINTALTNITHTTTGATGIGTATGLPAGVTAAWASNTITISGTPTASGTFSYSIPLTGGFGGSVNATGTITVSAGAPTAGAASSTPTLCINTALTNITHTTTNVTSMGTATGLPAGVTAAWTSNTITISGTPTASGTFNYTIPLTGGCGTVNATGTITVTAVNTAGAASSTPTLCTNTTLTNITHTTTSATGIGTATGLPAGVTAAWAGNTITISGTPTASGTFSYSIPLTGGCGSVNATGTITVRASGAWFPTDLGASLALWLDAADAASMTQSGGLVSQWNDKSGNNKHATQATSGNRPTFTASALNGKSVLTFDGNSDKMTIPALGLSNSAMVIMVFKATNAPHAVLSGSGNDTWDEYGGTSYAHHFRVVRLDNIGAPSPLSTNNILGYLANSTTPVYNRRLNGNASSTSNAAFTFSSNITEIGWNAPNNGYYLNGTISEIIVVNAYSVSDAEKLEGYLAEKWGLRANLPGGHTYKSIAPTNVTATTAGAASSTPTLCNGAALTNITHTTTGATGIGTAIGLPSGVTASWASNTITISGTPTATGTFAYSIPLTGGCGTANATGTITVGTAANTAGTASSTPTLCAGTALTNITRTTTNATGIGTATGLPAGVTAAWASNTITVSGTPTAGGTFNYTIPLTGGCGTVNATGTITVTINTAGAASSTPTLNINTALTNITHTTTGATGIGTAVGLPAGVTAAWASNTITISGTPTASGNYNYSIPLSGGCGTVNATGTINVVAFPGGVSSQMNVWLRADAGVSAIGTSWQDQSGNGRHYTTVAGPTVIASDAGGNNLPAVEILSGGFNGPAAAAIGTSWTLFSMHRLLPSDADGRLICTQQCNCLLANWSTASNGIYLDGNPNVLNTGIATTTNTQTKTLYCYSRDAATNNITVRVNGVLLATLTGTNSASGVSWNLNQGQYNEFTHSRIGEFMIYNRALSGAEITNVETYLKNKFCLTGGATMTAAAASSTPTVGINTVITNITHATTNATGIGTATGLPAGVSVAWSNNTITISGTPTASGTFNYSIPLRGACGTVNATGTITVVTSNTAAVASSTPTLCINTALTNITHATTGATGIGAATGLPAGVTAAWASNTITISGTPTASGTFAYSIPLTGGFGGSVSATGTITVTAANTAGTASSTPTLCINTALTNITRTTTGATGIGTATGLPAGVSAAWAGNVITISGTPTASGTFSYSIPLTGGCGAVNATGTITVSPVTVGGSVSGTATVCPGSNSGTLTLSGHTGSVVRWESSSASNFASPTTISSTATSYTYTNLSSVTYYRAVVQSGTCSSSNSSTATITFSEAVDGGRIEW